MGKHNLSIYALMFFFVLGNIFPSRLAARHGQQVPPWIDAAKNGAGHSCCGKQDCVLVINTAILEFRGDKALVMVNGRIGEVLYKALVPSEDKNDYVCFEEKFLEENEWLPCWSHKPDGTINIVVHQKCIKCLLVSPRT